MKVCPQVNGLSFVEEEDFVLLAMGGKTATPSCFAAH
jgi:hypothetical protein